MKEITLKKSAAGQVESSEFDKYKEGLKGRGLSRFLACAIYRNAREMAALFGLVMVALPVPSSFDSSGLSARHPDTEREAAMFLRAVADIIEERDQEDLP